MPRHVFTREEAQRGAAKTGFVAGRSANPGGRPSIVPALAANGLTTRKLTAELVKELLAVLRGPDKTSASWRWAAQTLWHATIGKPTETVRFAPEGDDEAIDADPAELQDTMISALDDEGLAAYEKVIEQIERAGMLADMEIPKLPT